jgi:hypothetical protein
MPQETFPQPNKNNEFTSRTVEYGLKPLEVENSELQSKIVELIKNATLYDEYAAGKKLPYEHTGFKITGQVTCKGGNFDFEVSGNVHDFQNVLNTTIESKLEELKDKNLHGILGLQISRAVYDLDDTSEEPFLRSLTVVG